MIISAGYESYVLRFDPKRSKDELYPQLVIAWELANDGTDPVAITIKGRVPLNDGRTVIHGLVYENLVKRAKRMIIQESIRSDR